MPHAPRAAHVSSVLVRRSQKRFTYSVTRTAKREVPVTQELEAAESTVRDIEYLGQIWSCSASLPFLEAFTRFCSLQGATRIDLLDPRSGQGKSSSFMILP